MNIPLHIKPLDFQSTYIILSDMIFQRIKYSQEEKLCYTKFRDKQ